MRLDELKDDNLAWDGLQADLSLQDIPGWLKRFVSSGLCGHRYQGDAFYASSNAMATWVDSLADLLQRKISETAKDNNAAAMREALELLNQLFDSCVLGTHSDMTADEMDNVDELYFKTKSALAAPPRNCDRFNTGDPMKDVVDAYGAWQRYCDDPTTPPSCNVESAFKYWLFAPAAERKGEGDGR
jgi:hypothetical protein